MQCSAGAGDTGAGGMGRYSPWFYIFLWRSSYAFFKRSLQRVNAYGFVSTIAVLAVHSRDLSLNTGVSPGDLESAQHLIIGYNARVLGWPKRVRVMVVHVSANYSLVGCRCAPSNGLLGEKLERQNYPFN